MDKNLLRLYRHEGHKADCRLLKRIHGTVVQSRGTRRRGRPQKRWVDVVSKLYRARGISDEDAK